MAGKARVGILGSDEVGETLGLGFAAHGYGLMVASRNASTGTLQQWLASVKAK